jgi:hypothetical protein
VDADKNLIRVSKTLVDCPELQAVRRLDGDLRRTMNIASVGELRPTAKDQLRAIPALKSQNELRQKLLQ